MFSFFKSLWAHARASSAVGPDAAQPRSDAGYETAEQHFARDVSMLDRESPGWSEGARVANAKLRLLRGMSTDDVSLLFGEATMREAQRQLRVSGESAGDVVSVDYAHAAAQVATTAGQR